MDIGNGWMDGSLESLQVSVKAGNATSCQINITMAATFPEDVCGCVKQQGAVFRNLDCLDH